jgi:branched-chain amino acid transport system permease protein
LRSGERASHIGKIAVGLALYFGLLMLMHTQLKGFYLGVMILFGINAIVCLGVSITNSYTNIFSLGFGGIMLIAAYTTSLLTLPVRYKAQFLHLPLWLENAQWPFVPALIAAGAVAVLSSVVLVLPAFRLRGHYFILASIGINIVMTNIGINFRAWTHGPLGVRNIPFYTNVWWVYGILLLTILFIVRLKRSKFGRAFVSIGKDQTLAAVLGVNVVLYKIYSFIIGSFIVGIGGALWVHHIGAMHPHVFELVFVFQVIAMLAIGGPGTISGAILGAAIITFFTQLARPVQEGFSLFGLEIPPLIGLIQVLIAMIIIIVMIYRPQGLLGRHEITWKTIRAAISAVFKKTRNRNLKG